jgi:hypothetical protein
MFEDQPARPSSAKTAGQSLSGRLRRRWRRSRGRRSLRLGRFHLTRSRTARGAAGKRQQSNIAGALDGHAEPTLVPRADSSHAARKNFAAFLHKLRKNVGALVVDQINLFDAKLADFLFAEKLALAAARSAGTATGAARTAFTARTAAWPAFATATTTAVTSMTTMSATAFTARRRTRRRCGCRSLRGCWSLILFV